MRVQLVTGCLQNHIHHYKSTTVFFINLDIKSLYDINLINLNFKSL